MQKEQMNIKVGKKLKENLEILAKNNEITLSELVRTILQAYINKLYSGEIK